MALCRLGVQSIVIVDNDTVEASNLNRQLLYSSHHVGTRKADAAAAGLKVHTEQHDAIAGYFFSHV